MCLTCSELKKEMVDSGKMTDDEFIHWLWNDTPFPVGEPSEEQVALLREMVSKK